MLALPVSFSIIMVLIELDGVLPTSNIILAHAAALAL